jgi:single-strand DNA-binding protein
MLNNITIAGRITHDLTLKEGNTPMLGFRIACDRDFVKGEKKTDFIDCTAFSKTAEFIQKFFGKGRMIIVRGRLQIDEWQDRDGNKRNSAKVIVDQAYFGDSKSPAQTSDEEQLTPTTRRKVEFTTIDEDDGDLPF